MEAIILKCSADARFHFGTTAPDNDTALSQTSECFHSDTLFSALVVLCNKVFPDMVNPLIEYFKSGGVTISSGSYCMDLFENGDFVRRCFFFPKPVHFNLLVEDMVERKTVSRVQYISKTIWEKGIAPKDWDRYKCYKIQGKFLLHPEDLSPRIGRKIDGLMEVKSQPKIADHARKKDNNIFFQTDLFLRSANVNQWSVQPHFFFLLDFQTHNEKLKNLIYLLIDILPDDGIGGSISTGCGQIMGVEKAEMNFSFQEKSAHQSVSMSLLGFEKGQMIEYNNLLTGKVIVRGGRNTARDGRLQRIKMIAEGALVKGEVKGSIISIHPEKPYLRNGKNFALPIHKNYEYNEATH